MKVPLSWLREYVDIPADTRELAKLLVMAGVGIEGIEGDVLDLEITANRADLLSMIGVAREAAVLLRAPVRIPEVKLAEAGDDVGASWKVEVPAPDLCPRYTARAVAGVKAGPAPAWMARRLEAAGIRAINAIVDITNYVLLETGQPLHAFDAGILRGRKLVVRRAAPGEKIQAIDGKEYSLSKDDLVIADAERPVAIAGVMGGKESEIGPRTTEVLIESAQFDPVSVRRTSRRLGLSSESSYRFERGIDPEAVDRASRRCLQLILELAGGKALKGAIDLSVPPQARPAARVRPSRVAKVLGLEVAPGRVREILAGLGARVAGEGDALEVTAPAGRRDLRIEADYIEEVARIEGYDRIPCDTRFEQRVAVDNAEDPVREEARATLAGLGAYEVLTWSFAEAGAKNRISFWTDGPLIPLRDPQGQVDRTLRESLAPGLLEVLRTNEGYKEELRPIFEIARVYRREGKGYGEKAVLGIAAPGHPLGVKGFLETLFARLGIAFDLVPKPFEFLEPGTGAEVHAGGVLAGYLGAPAAGLAGLRAKSSVAEVDFEALVRAARLVRPYREFNRKPPVERDLNVVVAERTSWQEIARVIRAEAPPTLEDVRYVDAFRGEQIGKGLKAVTLRAVFRAPDRTLTADEVESAMKAFLGALQRNLGARPR